MIYKIFPSILFLLFSIFSSETSFTKEENFKKPDVAIAVESTFDSKVETIYNSLNSNQFELPNLESFKEALKGFYLLKEKGLIQKDILTLVDFSLSSTVKRLWVIDLSTNTIYTIPWLLTEEIPARNLQTVFRMPIVRLKVV